MRQVVEGGGCAGHSHDTKTSVQLAWAADSLASNGFAAIEFDSEGWVVMLLVLDGKERAPRLDATVVLLCLYASLQPMDG